MPPLQTQHKTPEGTGAVGGTAGLSCVSWLGTKRVQAGQPSPALHLARCHCRAPENRAPSLQSALTIARKCTQNTRVSIGVFYEQVCKSAALAVAVQRNPPPVLSGVLYFPDAKMPCWAFMAGRQCSNGLSCDYAHQATSLTQLVHVINSAK